MLGDFHLLREKNMIANGTKCIVKSVPAGTSIYAHFIGQQCTPDEKNTAGGLRGKGDQFFNLVGSGAIFANGDSGFVVVPA